MTKSTLPLLAVIALCWTSTAAAQLNPDIYLDSSGSFSTTSIAIAGECPLQYVRGHKVEAKLIEMRANGITTTHGLVYSPPKRVNTAPGAMNAEWSATFRPKNGEPNFSPTSNYAISVQIVKVTRRGDAVRYVPVGAAETKGYAVIDEGSVKYIVSQSAGGNGG